MRTYKNYTDKDIIRIASKVTSMSQLISSLGLKPAGGNFASMKKNLQRLGLACEHWTGQAWNRGQRLKDWSEYSKVEYLKPHLISLRGHQCENCSRKTWLGQKISLEVHHLNGDKTNNNLVNLQLVCPNCHAQTNNYRGRVVELADTQDTD